MSLKISSLPPVTPLESPAGNSTQGGPAVEAGSSPFKDVLSSAMQEVEGARANANQSVQKFLAGEGEDLHSTILATQRADLEFQMFLQVRNKVVSAYQEVMKMQM
jgi:flagellar hook-basal body complex protein FliE